VPSYRFTGYAKTGYMAYRDLDSGLVLIAEPGGVYQMQSVTLTDPVPPNDGRWEPVPTGPPPPRPIPAPAPAAKIPTDTGPPPAEPPADEPPAE